MALINQSCTTEHTFTIGKTTPQSEEIHLVTGVKFIQNTGEASIYIAKTPFTINNSGMLLVRGASSLFTTPQSIYVRGNYASRYWAANEGF